MEPAVNIALRAARKASDIIAKASDRTDLINVSEKEANDFVTNIDRAAEEEIIYQINKAWPEHNILGEESGLIKGKGDSSDTTWIIDPLDGTTNFVRGIPHYAVSIGCQINGIIEHAVIVDPIRREEFTASRGRGAHVNGRRMRVSNHFNLSGALVGTGIPFRAQQKQYVDDYINCLKSVAENMAGIRRAGSAALDLAYVAAGRLDGFWELSLKPWDIAAGMLLIQEAGGLISDFSGGNSYLETGNIVCGNPKIFKALLQIINANINLADTNT